MKKASSVKSGIKGHKVSFKLPSEEHKLDMVDSELGDPLPIVELKPFVSKVWRREKSFVQTSDKCPSITDKSDKSDSVSEVANGSRNYDGVSEYGVDESSTFPPPRTAQSSTTAGSVNRLLSVYVNAYDDFKTQKEHFKTFASEYDLRRKPRERLHPLTDSKSKKQLEHSASIIPGFITRDDRTKTTLYEISDGDPTCKAYNCSPKAVRPEDFEKQQEIRISGQPAFHDHKTPYECTPTPVRGYHSLYQSFGIRHGSPTSLLTTARVMKERRMKRAKTPLYDSLDRSGTLPSLRIHATSLQKRESFTDEMDSEDFSDYREIYPPNSYHKIGGIENSLMILSKEGPPTKVERQLTLELESTLSRFRKSKDYSPFEINPSEIAKYCPTPVLKMTRGEEHIRQALQSNSSKRTQRSKTKLISNTRPLGSNHYNVQAALRKSYMAIDHIDSFDLVLNDDLFEEPTDRIRCPEQQGADEYENGFTEEELMVPYDTPRSHMDSRFSLRHPEDVRRVQSEPLNVMAGKEREDTNYNTINHVKKNDSRQRTTNTSKSFGRVNLSTSQNVERSRNRLVNGHVNGVDHRPTNTKDNAQNVRDTRGQRNSVPQGKLLKSLRPAGDATKDPSGRTFLTSDNILQVTTVNG